LHLRKGPSLTVISDFVNSMHRSWDTTDQFWITLIDRCLCGRSSLRNISLSFIDGQ